MSLIRPAFKELERFTFFVSRRREDGRERFRLHMGYFASRTDAEQWLSVVRTVYPGAWISDAPGKKLRGESPAPDLSATAASATGAHPALSEPESKPAVADTSATQSGLAPVIVPVQMPAAPPVLSAARPVPAAPPTPAPPIVHAPPPKPATPDSALQRLNDLSDSQVMRVLETPPANSQVTADVSDVPMVSKLDAHSLQALRKDLSKNLPVPFAVQLDWSPLPIDVQKIPPLAIFRAYTLYTVGCQFEGRRWYGLRLGFFTDALSAKQVAQYVRSEFKSVSVVPVSTRERTQADATGGIDVDKTAPVRHNGSDTSEEITLLPEGERPKASPVARTATNKAPEAKGETKGPAAKSSTAKPAAGSKSAANGARVLPRGAARGGRNRTLEETLEILGASQLTIENNRGERLNITGRQAAGSTDKTSTFSKLLDRLADRLRN
jgi:hypothetical protein